MAIRGGVAWSLILWFGCGQSGPAKEEASRERTKAVVSGPVVATVDGQPVSLEDVKQTSQATGLTPEQALRRIEEEFLLASYAERAGYGEGALAKHEVDAARVRALLRTAVERGTGPSDIREQEVRERFESVRQAQEKPERRAVVHVVFRAEKGANDAKAQRAAEGLLSELRPLTLEAATDKILSLPPRGERDGVPFTRENLAEVRRDGGLATEFVEASFSNAAPALLQTPVKTLFGFHVIAVKGILPAVTLIYEDFETPIREKLSSEKRARALDALLSEIKKRDAVRYHEDVIAKELAKDEILGPGF